MARRITTIWTSTANLAAQDGEQSEWIDCGKRKGDVEVLRTSTGGTYRLTVEWSPDGGETITDTVVPTTVSGEVLSLGPKQRYGRFLVQNTHASQAFSAHSTVVRKDVGAGVAG